MSTLSDRARCEGHSSGPSEIADSEESLGWDDDVSIYEHQNIDLVKLANQKISLLSVLNNYQVDLEQLYSVTGWSHRGNCPFPDHQDSTPSFGYNSIEDRFNCFGCHRAGRAVEFIAFIENKSRLDVARNILANYGENLNISSLATFDEARLQRLLFDYADYVRAFKRRNNNSIVALQFAQDVTWNLDVYLAKHARTKTIILDNLEVRLQKLKEQLDLFEL